ncbi:MAG: DUF3237 domain-containing protein [Acidimicrobiales bacterium]|nr:DUF3237 domain-containing protein [Acidimicrobiales bacterium]
MQLEHLLNLRAELKDPITVGETGFGTRQIVDVVGGTFEGPGLTGTVLPSGADWLTIGSDGTARLDVRATLETDDGALIYVQYPGVMVINEAAMNALAGGGETQFGEVEFFTQPRCETGHPDYAWLNRVVAVGQGRLFPNGVEYNISRVVN